MLVVWRVNYPPDTWVAVHPELPGAWGQGNSPEAAIADLRGATALILEHHAQTGRYVPDAVRPTTWAPPPRIIYNHDASAWGFEANSAPRQNVFAGPTVWSGGYSVDGTPPRF